MIIHKNLRINTVMFIICIICAQDVNMYSVKQFTYSAVLISVLLQSELISFSYLFLNISLSVCFLTQQPTQKYDHSFLK